MILCLGTAGLPIVSKGKSTENAIKDIANLGLNSIEIQFSRGIYLNKSSSEQIGKIAKDYHVKLSIHCPYWLNLNSENKRVVEESKDRILKSAELGSIMDASVVVAHSAYYGKLTPKETITKVAKELKDITPNLTKTKIGIEIGGKAAQFGTLDEILDLCRKTECIPVVDFGHHYVRNRGKIDYAEVFDKVESIGIKHLHSHFEGVRWNGKAFADVHEPIGDNPPFEPLAKEILKRKLDVTIICESPMLEIDSLNMKHVLEKLGYKP